MKALPAVCPRERAARSLVGWWSRWRTRRSGSAVRLELVYLQEFLAIVHGSPRGPTRGGWIAINSQVESMLDLGSREPSWNAGTALHTLGAEPDRAVATRLLRAQLRRAKLRRGAWLLEPVAHPYWVCYVPRSGDRLDVRVLDAVSGRPAALRLKLTLLDALVADSRITSESSMTPSPTLPPLA